MISIDDKHKVAKKTEQNLKNISEMYQPILWDVDNMSKVL